MKQNRSTTALFFRALRLFVLLASLLGSPVFAQSTLDVSQEQCASLLTAALPDTSILSAELLAANTFQAPDEEDTMTHPAFCRVVARTEPQVNFEVWLPAAGWNGKFQGVGNGGMAGTISYGAMLSALQRGYATASTDTGHAAGDVAFDASWALGRPDLVEDFGHRSLHLTTVHGKSLTSQLYGEPPQYAYYVGCSKGGQQGLMEAQRYPDDYDGIIAGDPAHNWTRFYAGGHLWYSLALLADGESYLPPTKLAALGAAVNKACDARDGIADGILNNPLACDFDPGVLACPAGVDDPSCLTQTQITAVNQIWSGVTDSSGELVFPPLVRGGEAAPGGWANWVTGREPFSSLHWLGGEGFFRYMVFEDPDWDFRSFDFDKDLQFALEKVGPMVDANDPDLSKLRDGGAKLLIYHGLSDPDISPLSSINYFEEVLAHMSPNKDRQTALTETNDFLRLFLVPGMGHCSGGPGPDNFDALTALENWVERGVAPEHIVASKIIDGVTTMSRPLCNYPGTAKWDGRGDTNSASSFSCVAP